MMLANCLIFLEAGVGIEPAYTDLQGDRQKKSPENQGSRKTNGNLRHKSAAQFWHSHSSSVSIVLRNNAFSALRRLTRPGSSLPPPLVHCMKASAAPSQSSRPIFIRIVER